MSALEREIENFLKLGVFSPIPPVYNTTTTKNYFINSNEESYNLEIPMVGILKENLTVDVQEDKLTITAKADTKVSYYAKDFKQTWTLAKDVNVDAVAAKLEHGILTVSVPRIKPVKKVVNVAIA